MIAVHPSARRELRRRKAHLWRTLLRPPPRLTLSEWADRERVLSPEASAEPGPWRTARAPYLREIQDTISHPLVRRVCWMSSSQVGKTEVVNNVVGYHIDLDPAPIMVVQPTKDMAEAWSKDRLAPMLRDSPALRDKVKPARTRDSGNTLLHKSFPGGHITIVGSNSPSGLASRPIRVLLPDEVDRYRESAGSEGDPIDLATQRTATFWNRKIVMLSTPGIAGESRIEAEWKRSDQRRFYVPCPHCDQRQVLAWGGPDSDHGIRWDREKGDDDVVVDHPETAGYECVHCHAIIEEADKRRMLAAGEWRVTNPAGDFPGFHLNALYSPWASWADLVREWLRAQGDVQRLQVFINTKLGEPWEDRTGQLEVDGLAERAEDYGAEVPKGVGLLTAAVDVQGDRLELLIRGWGAQEESWGIRHVRIYGDPELQDVWQTLEQLLVRPWTHVSGATLRVMACMVDSGWAPKDVYRFVAPREGRGVYASKGLDTRASEPLKRSTRKNRGKVKLWTVGTYSFKAGLFRRLRIQQPGPGYMHFPPPQDHGFDGEYFAQFKAERLVSERHGGRIVKKWKQVRTRNEAIDLEVLAHAALYTLPEVTREQLGDLARALEEAGPGQSVGPTSRRKRRGVRSRGIR